MAASASIGGGFWGSDHGVELVAYLRKNYQELMLDHQLDFVVVAGHESYVSKNGSPELVNFQKDLSVAAVNGFLLSQSPSQLFF